jgi:Mrp family chromosome partitioning ATPase
VLSAGAPVADPMAVLASPRMKMVLDEAAARFDWVLVDTPPIGLLPDASLVARLVDGVLLVVGAGQTDYRLVQRAVAELGADRIIGTILNRAEQETITGNEYYAHYYVGDGA